MDSKFSSGGDSQSVHNNHYSIDDRDTQSQLPGGRRSRYATHFGGDGHHGVNGAINNSNSALHTTNNVNNLTLDNTTRAEKKRKRGLSPQSTYLNKTLKRAEIDKDIYKITQDTKFAIDYDGSFVQDNEELRELNDNRPQIDLKIEKHCFYYNYRVDDDDDDEGEDDIGGGVGTNNLPDIIETKRVRKATSKYRQEEKETSSTKKEKEKEKLKEKVEPPPPPETINPHSDVFGKYTVCFQKKTPCWVTKTETDDIYRGLIFSFNQQEIVVKLTNQSVLPDQKTTPHASYYNVSNKLYISVEDLKEAIYLLDEITTND